MAVAERFYEAFMVRDFYTMGLLYANHAAFSDPIFPRLSAKGVRLMWQMVLTEAEDLALDVKVLEDTPDRARIPRRRAAYTPRLDRKPERGASPGARSGDSRRARHAQLGSLAIRIDPSSLRETGERRSSRTRRPLIDTDPSRAGAARATLVETAPSMAPRDIHTLQAL